jgi:hypothetical protein
MAAIFVGGPYDGMALDHRQINAFAMVVPVFRGPQSRQFLMMPPRGEWDRLVRGEIAKDQAVGDRYIYERVFVPGGDEYREVSGNVFNEAMEGKIDPAWQEMMDNLPHEKKLAMKLEGRLSAFLADAHLKVIEPGTLAAGMGFDQRLETSSSYDAERALLTVMGVVKIEVRRVEEVEDT